MEFQPVSSFSYLIEQVGMREEKNNSERKCEWVKKATYGTLFELR